MSPKLKPFYQSSASKSGYKARVLHTIKRIYHEFPLLAPFLKSGNRYAKKYFTLPKLNVKYGRKPIKEFPQHIKPCIYLSFSSLQKQNFLSK